MQIFVQRNEKRFCSCWVPVSGRSSADTDVKKNMMQDNALQFLTDAIKIRHPDMGWRILQFHLFQLSEKMVGGKEMVKIAFHFKLIFTKMLQEGFGLFSGGIVVSLCLFHHELSNTFNIFCMP